MKGYTLSWKYRASKDMIGVLALEAAQATGWEVTTERIILDVVVVEPDFRPRDLNWSKNLKDGITASAAIWDDDRQVRVERWTFAENVTRSPHEACAMITITKTGALLHGKKHSKRRTQSRDATAARPTAQRRQRD